jgi:hypothetical protein
VQIRLQFYINHRVLVGLENLAEEEVSALQRVLELLSPTSFSFEQVECYAFYGNLSHELQGLGLKEELVDCYF